MTFIDTLSTPCSGQLTVMYLYTIMSSSDWGFQNSDIVYSLHVSCFRFDIKSLTFEGEQDETGIKDAAANSEFPNE